MSDKFDDLVAAHRAEIHKPPAHLVQQWHAAIDEAEALERGRQAPPGTARRPGLAFLGLAVTAAMALGIGIGIVINDDEPAATVEPAVSTAAFSRGLQYHLRDSRAQLVSLESGNADASQLVLQIIAQNRFFEVAAEQHDAPEVARVLRAFESILLRLTADDIAPEDAAALRRQLEFEIRVMLTKLAREASDKTYTT